MPETRSLVAEDDCKEVIDALDLRPIKFMLCLSTPRGLGWSEERADRAILEYRRFLTLKAKNRSARIVPTKIVDQVWHQHILDTKKYELDCQAIFGGILHHNPYLGLRDDVDVWEALIEETRSLYSREFDGVSSINGTSADFDAADVESARCSGCDAGDIAVAGEMAATPVGRSNRLLGAGQTH